VSQQCNVGTLMRACKPNCVWNYTSKNMQSANPDFQIVAFYSYLFALSIPPTWQRVMRITSLTSLHLVYSRRQVQLLCSFSLS